MTHGDLPAAQSAFGPMVLAAIEQHERPQRRLVDDDLAAAFLPPALRRLAAAMRWTPARRALIAVTNVLGPGLWANIACRKRFIDDRLRDSLGAVDAVVILGAGMDTRAYRLVPEQPVFEVDLPVNIARKAETVQRVLGGVPSNVRLVPVDFETDDLATELADSGYRADHPTFFVWEGVTQYLTADAVHATFAFLQKAASGSRLTFTYIRADFIGGVNLYGAKSLYRRFRQRRQVWHFGLHPESVPKFLADYGWHLVLNAGPDYFEHHCVKSTRRKLAASQIEWSVYAEKR